MSDRPEASELAERFARELQKLRELEGFVGAAFVDSETGILLASEGGSSLNLEVACFGDAAIVRAKRRTIRDLEATDDIEDILITQATEYFLLRPLRMAPALFIYLVVDRRRANLALTRRSLAAIEEGLGPA